jgi:hypothetical protein
MLDGVGTAFSGCYSASIPAKRTRTPLAVEVALVVRYRLKIDESLLRSSLITRRREVRDPGAKVADHAWTQGEEETS